MTLPTIHLYPQSRSNNLIESNLGLKSFSFNVLIRIFWTLKRIASNKWQKPFIDEILKYYLGPIIIMKQMPSEAVWL